MTFRNHKNWRMTLRIQIQRNSFQRWIKILLCPIRLLGDVDKIQAVILFN